MAYLLCLSRSTQICVAHGIVSWGSEDKDTAGELQLWYRELDNHYHLYASNTKRDDILPKIKPTTCGYPGAGILERPKKLSPYQGLESRLTPDNDLSISDLNLPKAGPQDCKIMPETTMKVTKDTVTISELMEWRSCQKGQTVQLKDADPNERQQFIDKMPASIKEKMQDLRGAGVQTPIPRPSREIQQHERDLERQLREMRKREENLQRQFRELKQNSPRRQQREGNLQRQLRETQQREENSQRQLRETQQREENLQRQLRETQQREGNLERQVRESQQREENLQRQLREKDQEVNELELSLSLAQQTISEQRRQETCDWVISRNEIQMTENCLGRGGWGSVNEGAYCGCTVAVKQIHDLILSRHNRLLFEREMNIASACRHPCLLQFIGATNDEGSPLFVTELMEKSLRALFEERPLSKTEIRVISLDVARALNYLHQKKPSPIIHRDVSSANVLLWRQGDQWRGKVSDYGTANFMQQAMTVAPGAMIYSAPEALSSNQTPKVGNRLFQI
ncbi:unnamed protein product [Porites lobata]|uniref:Protein kinase domain-containing protein n=1 Tax=Porites lobata TaxID=104759 RepID=A0ABN8R1Q6_9CNID|nr:unnamed protein product [Porites lobata]